MIEIHIDEAKNLFTVCYHGHVTAEETAAWVEPMRLALGKMRPGFGLLADLTDLQAMDADCAPHIREVMDFANAHGIAAVVRVIPDPGRDIGMKLMSYFHYGANVQIATADTVEAAMKTLFD